jgi:CBS domain-containing protein
MPVILVHHILEAARRRLAMLSREASVCDAAAILANPHTPLVVVCDGDVAVGVISRADIIKLLAREGSNVFGLNTGAVMTAPVLSCRVDETLQRVWEILNARSFRCAPVLDNDGRLQGVVHSRDLARALLDEVTHEEELLRDYVLGIGYQ